MVLGGLIYSVKIVATIILAVVLFPLELIASLLGASEPGIASSAIRSLWGAGSNGSRELESRRR